MLIGYHPGKGHVPALNESLHHLQRQLRLCLEAQLRRDPIALAQGQVRLIEPLLGYIETPI